MKWFTLFIVGLIQFSALAETIASDDASLEPAVFTNRTKEKSYTRASKVAKLQVTNQIINADNEYDRKFESCSFEVSFAAPHIVNTTITFEDGKGMAEPAGAFAYHLPVRVGIVSKRDNTATNDDVVGLSRVTYDGNVISHYNENLTSGYKGTVEITTDPNLRNIQSIKFQNWQRNEKGEWIETSSRICEPALY